MRVLPATAMLFTLIGCAGTGQTPAAETTRSSVTTPRLYMLDCGALAFKDISAFGLSNADTPVRDMIVPCYLIEHAGQTLLWDAGLPLSLVGKGSVTVENGTTLYYERSVVDQLADLGHTPESIDLMALSHLHFDHCGAANAFATARLLIQEPEWDAAFEHSDQYQVFRPELYEALRTSEKTVLNGDHDVFGDGRVRILSAYGHTPGHQVLFIDLENTGPLVLSGDLYHFRFSRVNRRTPSFNTDREQTLQSMQKVEQFLQASGATLWIEHDRALAATLKKAPAYYD